jgi:competence protein ComEA
VAVLVALGAGLLAWRSRPVVASVAPPPSAASETPAPEVIVVAVMGRVHRPGLVEVPAGARVADALAAAGGPLPDTDLTHLNLARRLVDGELITVGVAGSPDGGGSGGLVNLNTATSAQLQELPGIGPVLAQRIVDYRTRWGAFRSVDDLRKVPGIGEATFAELESLVTV